MNTEQIRTSLGRIRDIYKNIENMTRNLLNCFSDELLKKTLKERDGLLDTVSAEEACIKGFDQTSGDDLREEIKTLINGIILSDRKIAELVRGRMVQIKKEMSGLFTSTKAARAYTSHGRR